MITALLKHKKVIGIVLTLIATLTGIATYHATVVSNFKNSVTEKVTTEIQKEHNRLITEQIVKHQNEMQAKISEYNKKLAEANEQRDTYWQNYYANKERELLDKHKRDLEIASINDEADTIDINNNITDTTFRLLNKARSIVSKPANYEFRVKANSQATAVAKGVADSVLPRSYAEPVGNNKRSWTCEVGC